MNKTDAALANILNSLASKLGTTVDHLYGILIKQAFIDAIQILVTFAIFTIALFFYLRFLRKEQVAYNAKDHSGTYSSGFWDDNFGYTVISGIVIMAYVVLFVCTIKVAPTALLNPEYYALKDIIK